MKPTSLLIAFIMVVGYQVSSSSCNPQPSVNDGPFGSAANFQQLMLAAGQYSNLLKTRTVLPAASISSIVKTQFSDQMMKKIVENVVRKVMAKSGCPKGFTPEMCKQPSTFYMWLRHIRDKAAHKEIEESAKTELQKAMAEYYSVMNKYKNFKFPATVKPTMQALEPSTTTTSPAVEATTAKQLAATLVIINKPSSSNKKGKTNFKTALNRKKVAAAASLAKDLSYNIMRTIIV